MLLPQGRAVRVVDFHDVDQFWEVICIVPVISYLDGKRRCLVYPLLRMSPDLMAGLGRRRTQNGGSQEIPMAFQCAIVVGAAVAMAGGLLRHQ